MLYIVKCLGGNQGSHDQLNVNQQMIAFTLCWDINIDIAGILYNDLVAKLTIGGKKGGEKNICYVRYLSIIMEHLLGEDYLNKDLKPMKPYQITDATFKDSSISEVPLTSHMRKVAKLPEKPLKSHSENANIEACKAMSFSGTSELPSSKLIAETDKKRRLEKNPSSAEPISSHIVKIQTSSSQASDSQHADTSEVPADIHQSLKASKSAEEQDNQPKTANTKKEQENNDDKHSGDELDDGNEFVDPRLHSIGDVPLESLNASTNDSIYDTELEIKIVKRFKPIINDEEPLITKVTEEHPIMEEESDLESMPGDEIGSVSTSDTYGSEEDDTHSQHVELSKSEERDADKLLEELVDMNASTDKPSLSDQLDNLSKEMTNKLEEIVPSLVAESFKKNLPELISESLKNVIPQITAKSVKEIIKPINRQFNAFNKLEAVRFVKLHTGLRQDLKKKVGISLRKEVHKGMDNVKGKLDYYAMKVDQNSVNVQDMKTQMRDIVAILDSASVFAKTNVQGEHLSENKSESAMIIHTSEEKTSEDEPPFKRPKFEIPREILSPTPLKSIMPQLTTRIVINIPKNQDSSTLSKPTDKGKSIATEEDPTKALIPFLEESGSTPKISDLKSFSSDRGLMTLENAKAQLEEFRRIELLKVEKEKSERELANLLNPATVKAQTLKLAEYEAKRLRDVAVYYHQPSLLRL
ncbi:hypothetical protein Tco_0868037 [Tanacetum coccineum]